MWNETSPGAENLPSLCLVKTVGGQMEAMILKARLEAEEIPVHLRYEPAGFLYGFSTTDLGRVEVLVPEVFAAAARQICAEAEGGADPPGSAA